MSDTGDELQPESDDEASGAVVPPRTVTDGTGIDSAEPAGVTTDAPAPAVPCGDEIDADAGEPPAVDASRAAPAALPEPAVGTANGMAEPAPTSDLAPAPSPDGGAADEGGAEQVGPSTADGEPAISGSDELEAISGLAGMIDRLAGQVDELTRLGSRHASHVEQLHSENQRLRAGELATATAPFVRDVIRLHDDVVRLALACAPEASLDIDLVRKLVLSTLDRWDAHAFSPTAGDTFDAKEHHGVGRVDTATHPDGTIAATRRCGFRQDDGRVLRPAEVEVFRRSNAEVEDTAGVPAGEG